jgi:hypothetical protein
MRIKLQRLVKVWVEDVYEIKQLDKETKELMFNYELEPKSTETLWETQVDVGPYEILDKNNKTIEEGSL